MKFGGYLIGTAQIDDEIKEKLIFSICSTSTIILLVSRSDLPDMRCFSIGGMKNQHDAILESTVTTKDISFQSPTYNQQLTLFFALLPPTLEIWNLPTVFALLNLRNSSESNFDLAAKLPRSKLFLAKF